MDTWGEGNGDERRTTGETGKSGVSTKELDVMIQDVLPALGHFPRSDASIAFALNELDTLLSEEDADSEDQEDDDVLEYQGDTQTVCGVSHSLRSHRIDFVLEYPHMTIVTTASLPWLTGTAVNPALRAAYLWQRGHDVTLLVPWIPRDDQKNIFQSEEELFDHPEDQLEVMQMHIRKRVPFEVQFHRVGAKNSPALEIKFYGGKYAPALGSIIPTQDIQQFVRKDTSCIILEEPEHLTWYHSGKRWIRAFDRHVPVIGVMHTNYVDYARRMAGEAASVTLKRLNRFLCRQHTHKVIKLSGAVQRLPRDQVCFVHGVSDGFLAVGRQKERIEFSKGAYFLGKALWAKGFEELLDRMEEHVHICSLSGAQTVPVDVYGHGKEFDEIKNEATHVRHLPLYFWGPKDHLSHDMVSYRVFVNPSTSDVVATTSAEALAMGKWLLVPKHPCNVFFESFSNCLIYENGEQFGDLLKHAASNDPHPLSDEELNKLSWPCATDRFLFCCSDTNIERGKKLGITRVVNKTSWMGYNVGYGVYSIVTKAMDSVLKAISNNEGKRK
jgi:digalactosyldiacylglycerol synthase